MTSLTNKITGINVSGHDSSIAVLDGEVITFAAHSERYSEIKEDPNLFNPENISGKVAISDAPFLLHVREILSGERKWYDFSPTRIHAISSLFKQKTFVGHHRSHVAAGFYTSGFFDAVAICVDAIGELDTVTIWKCDHNTIGELHGAVYPDSIGLLYTAFTLAMGFKHSEEYVVMSHAALGTPRHKTYIYEKFIKNMYPFELKEHVHRGIVIDIQYDVNDMAASIQAVFEEVLLVYAQTASQYSDNLILSGGTALNCVANSIIADAGLFKNIWIYFNPGDAGNALGAALWVNKTRPSNGRNPFLGYCANDISDQVSDIVGEILKSDVVGVLHDRAEFGPRALGHRSILADPRKDIKSKVNQIKGRPSDRPFAASILEEHAEKYFLLNPVCDYSYMQYAVPFVVSGYDAIRHADTCRIQVVKKDDPNFAFIRSILEEWHTQTGCPMLLHTSLNIKGQPIVNSANQLRFGKTLKVFS